MATMSRTRVQQDGSTVESPEPESNRVVLKLKKPAKKRHVAWTTGTVDNENLNRRKSKCCCVYVKPHEFGESSSDSEADECEHCSGHVERRRQRIPASASTVVATAAEDCVDTGDATLPEPRRRVAWAADTIDNENMNKRKSKCCCIFEKRREFGESSSDSEADDCANCRGHKERRYKNAKPCEPMLPNPFSVHGDAS